MSVPLPQYGNFGGNGDNDAWEQADRYLTWKLNGYVQVPTTGPDGSKNIVVPPPELQVYHIQRHPEEATFVKMSMNAVGRKPKDDLDNVYLNHDIGAVGDTYVHHVVNNVSMAYNVYGVITTLNNGLEWNGYLYGTTSAPFIGYAGSAHAFFTDLANDVPIPTRETIIHVEDVIVTAGATHTDTIDVYYTIEHDNTFYSGLSNLALTTWNSVTSTLGSWGGSILDAFSGAAGWLGRQLSMLSNRVAPIDEALPEMEQRLFDAGQFITTAEARFLDENDDGVLSHEDFAFTYLGLQQSGNEGVTDLETSDISEIAIPSGDGHMVMISGSALVVTRDFGIVYSATSPADDLGDSRSVGKSFTDGFQLVEA
jgi:hypothetical protein